LFYDNQAMSELEELFSPLNYKDFVQLRYNVPKNTLQSRVHKAVILDYAKEILAIAERSLKRLNTGEEAFLESIKELVTDGVTPADIILKNWYHSWNKNLGKLVEYLINLE
jgi:gamma-glutamylcysteine synthetase